MTPKVDHSGALVYELSNNEYDALAAKVAALDVAERGLRDLEDRYEPLAERIDGFDTDRTIVYRDVRTDLSALLDKIRATR